jgi:hypothetical protein
MLHWGNLWMRDPGEWVGGRRERLGDLGFIEIHINWATSMTGWPVVTATN